MAKLIPKGHPKKKKRPRAPSLPSLITKADTLASRYIRQKYADQDGMVHCVSCETVLHWKDMHNAHYMPRSAKNTRWMEENLHPACPSCNVYRKEHHMREYTLYMIGLYGMDGLEEIKADSRKVLRGPEVRQLATEAVEYYTNALKEL